MSCAALIELERKNVINVIFFLLFLSIPSYSESLKQPGRQTNHLVVVWFTERPNDYLLGKVKVKVHVDLYSA